VLDVLANAAGNGILNTLAGWISAGAPLAGWAVLTPYPFAVASVHLATTLADCEADSKMGLKTSGVALGVSRGIFLSTALMAAAVIAAYLSGNNPALIASLLSLPFFLIPARFVTRPEKNADALIPAKAATLIFSVTAGFLFPIYIPFLAAVILLTRLYYARRFGIEYPSFRRA
jgi:1,4-dihydroxy-2-naphthoate octaprenyltransferase